MSPAEVGSRVHRRLLLERWRRRACWPRPSFVTVPSASSYVLPGLEGEAGVEEAVAQADGQLAGRVEMLAQVFSTDDTDWRLDPQTGVRTPLEFGPLLEYRDGAAGGNTRNVWELSRHQHLVPAALAYASTRDERYASYVREQLRSWLAQDPFPLGINWNSPLEFALRMVSWVWIGRLLTGSPSWEVLFGVEGILWDTVYRHQWATDRLSSVGSSANNHLIGEMAGLFIAAGEWPFFDESPGWARRAYRVLHREIDRQYHPSGANREQAYAYHLFATELLLVAAVEGERFGRPFAPEFKEALARAIRVAGALAGPGSLRPTYGDSDDGLAVGLPGRGDVLARLQAVGAEWLGLDSASRARDDHSSGTGARLLLSGVRAPDGPAGAAPSGDLNASGPPPARSDAGGRSFALRDAGLFRLVAREDGMEIVCLADAGPLGYLSIAAHGHADCLSFTLSADDEMLLVDPGTYTYHHDPVARAYFRGTSAHNTVLVDDTDQSEPAGPFLWLKKAAPTVHRWEPGERGGLLVASHDGYERLARPVRHERHLILDGRTAAIDDILTGEAVHEVEWRLHAAPHCLVHLDGSGCEVRGRGHRLAIDLDRALAWELLRADARGGWYSPSFNRREPTTTLVGRATLRLPARLHHTVTVSR